MTQIKDKVIWLTGASSGIGEATAYQLASKGARLVLSARRESELLRVKESCARPGGDILVLPIDLADYQQMPAKAEIVRQYFGRIDLLINNGGLSQRSLIVDTEMDVYEKLMRINYLGTVALSKAVLPLFVQQQSGHFVVVTSLMGKFASMLRSGYCGAKHALHGFFDALRLEHEQDNIKVTMVCPGFVRTNISLNALTGDGSAQNSMDKMTEKGLSAEECARQLVKAIERNKREVYIGGKETFAVYLKRLSPGLLHKVVKRSAVS